MVLQRDRQDAIWGWTTPGAHVSVKLGDKTSSAVAGPDGKWTAYLPKKPAGGPYTIDVSGPQSVELKNVLFGDVWICSGQSNMQFGVQNLANANEEIAAADHPNIRLFMVPNVTAATPQSTVQGTWNVCTPSTITQGGWGGFTAVGYFFGRNLERDLHVPIGLIETSWGGTVAEAWVSTEGLKDVPGFQNVDEIVSDDLNTTQVTDEELAARNDKWAAASDPLSKKTPNPSDPAYDDSSWKTMNLPTAWEAAGLPDFDGTVWFRRTFELTSAQTGKDLALHLGPIDDRDTTWVNGVRVGGDAHFDRNRDYTIPSSALHEGTNVIAIRVLDTGGAGGVDGKPEQMHVDLADGGSIALAGPWRYAVSAPLSELPAPPATDAPAIQNVPTMLYNAMVSPLIPYGIKGAIWYQGEANVGRAEQYKKLLPALIEDWRGRWGEGNFPFLIVQLANYMAVHPEPTDDGWIRIEEAQAHTAKTVPNTGLSVTNDIGDANDIHPKNKQEVGRRLELIALATVYGRNVEYSGPEFSAMKVDGRRVILSFKHVDGGLVAHGDKLTGFAIAGDDKKFVWADAAIEGDHIVLSSPLVPHPAAVRYAWASNPICNFYNKAGLPAIPFRTDSW
jgi:sialate O-acetylesterase